MLGLGKSAKRVVEPAARTQGTYLHVVTPTCVS